MIINRQRRVSIAEAALARFLSNVRRELKVPWAKVTVCFVTDAEIAKLNGKFRRKPKATDVLSFPAREYLRGKRGVKNGSTTTAGSENFLGDIAISPETACRNAKKYGRSVDEEIRILMIHGTLHLLGYDHEVDSGEMERLELRLRRRLRLA
jgi:probable rRNA maturation factor